MNLVDLRIVAESLPKTRKKYLTDSYAKEMMTDIVATFNERGKKYYLVSRETIFHPLGGGQPSDTGFILGENFQFQVKKVLDVNGVLFHYGILSKGELPQGNANAKLLLDWDKRYKIMRIHTAGHILDYAVNEVLGGEFETLSASHSAENAYVEYKIPPSLKLDLRSLEAKTNEVAKSCLQVRVVFAESNDIHEVLKNAPNLRRLPNLTEYRIVVIDKVNSIPCSGTHVANTCEIGEIKVLKSNETPGGVAIYYDVYP